ncbi:hypothetical protein GZH47_13545 [Paenibacillus rhizovicinus]|uniref:Uncharacterized protein n=1 Tax=Paenibacillus rhizovicinus TaxID=2704463 RepID=A0A6C0P526_9BACL|nr:hypothetical protein [Paenibacillus rhizovicinus]QHW31762.1 hypothetical protein GZH47_13545 [Paenibacillus rhizovicinus]
MSSQPAIVYTSRICDSDTMTNKLIYQIRQNQLSPTELNKLQARCNRELNELRQELNDLLNDLRAIADRSKTEPSAADRVAAAGSTSNNQTAPRKTAA